MNFPRQLMMKNLPQRWTRKKETDNWQIPLNGIRMKLLRSGLSVQKPQVPIFWLTRPKPSNISMKSRTLLKLPSNGLARNLSWLKKTWEVSDSTFWMLLSMLTLSTEVEDKLSQLPEEYSMVQFWLLHQDSKNLSSYVKSKPLMMPWVVSINAWPQEEVLLLEKNQSMELH